MDLVDITKICVVVVTHEVQFTWVDMHMSFFFVLQVPPLSPPSPVSASLKTQMEL